MKTTIANILFACVMLIGSAIQNSARAAQQCDPEKPETTPTSRFEINQTDGTAYDTKSKLTWRICSEGQVHQEGRCTGIARAERWGWYAHNPLDGWRAPNEEELKSIVEERCQNPAINLTVFQDTQSLPYWTKSGDKKFITGWAINFQNGEILSINVDDDNYARFVRGEEWFDPVKEEARKQARKSELAEQQIKLPHILKEMSNDDFCVAYGDAVQETTYKDGVLPDIMRLLAYLKSDNKRVMRLMKAEAHRRELLFNDAQIKSFKFVIGMTECQLYATNGLPREQNRTTSKWGVDIQHVYGSSLFVYTVNGRVTAWQEF